MKKHLTPAIWVAVFLAISYVIGLFTRGNMAWYDTLAKSSLTPPDIAFPIMWSALYVLLALCGWRVWEGFSRRNGKTVFLLYWLVMPLNWAWSFIFFEFQMVSVGFFWIMALNASMIAFIAAGWAHNRAASLLMLPTLIWCSFAAYLNYTIWALNP